MGLLDVGGRAAAAAQASWGKAAPLSDRVAAGLSAKWPVSTPLWVRWWSGVYGAGLEPEAAVTQVLAFKQLLQARGVRWSRQRRRLAVGVDWWVVGVAKSCVLRLQGRESARTLRTTSEVGRFAHIRQEKPC
jgi:hypothetical protein